LTLIFALEIAVIFVFYTWSSEIFNAITCLVCLILGTLI
jgi:hypothetical protein